MKKLFFLILISILFFGCQLMPEDTGEINATDEAESDPLPETDDDPIIDPTLSPVILALYDGENLNYYDGTDFTNAYSSVNFKYAGSKTGAIDDILYYFDEYGASTATYQLPSTPDHILTVPEPNPLRAAETINGENVWTFENIDPATAQSMGAMYKNYTRIFKNYTEFGNWYLNEYQVNDVHAFNNKIIIKDSSGSLKNLSDSAVPYKSGNDFLITDIDFNYRTAVFNGANVSFSQNYFYSSKWQKCGDIFQSQHGLLFDGSTLTEEATALKDFIAMKHPNNENYSLWPAGERTENSESVSYWIDSTSGWLVRYVPSVDRYGMPIRLFVGPMNYATGNTSAPDIKPKWIDDQLYFHWSGSVFVYDPTFATVQVFSDDMEILNWN